WPARPRAAAHPARRASGSDRGKVRPAGTACETCLRLRGCAWLPRCDWERQRTWVHLEVGRNPAEDSCAYTCTERQTTPERRRVKHYRSTWVGLAHPCRKCPPLPSLHTA